MTHVPVQMYTQWLIRLGENKSNYPYYDFFHTRTGTDELFVLEIAVAGIRIDQIHVFFSKQNFLTITTDINLDTDHNYIYKGIARRNFKEIFKVHYSLKMFGDAHLEDGILRVIFIKEIYLDEENESVKILTHSDKQKQLVN